MINFEHEWLNASAGHGIPQCFSCTLWKAYRYRYGTARMCDFLPMSADEVVIPLPVRKQELS